MESVTGTTFSNLTLDSEFPVEPDSHVSDTNNWLLAVAIFVALALFCLLAFAFRSLLRIRSSRVRNQDDMERAKSHANSTWPSPASNPSAPLLKPPYGYPVGRNATICSMGVLMVQVMVDQLARKSDGTLNWCQLIAMAHDDIRTFPVSHLHLISISNLSSVFVVVHKFV
ncbi:hypothetical protein OSTOST_25964 [Ostertagia ostertagi]